MALLIEMKSVMMDIDSLMMDAMKTVLFKTDGVALLALSPALPFVRT